MYPVLFKIGTFEVHSFGVAMVVAFLLSVTLAQARGPRYGITRAQIGDMAFWAILAGVFGARFLFIVQEWGYFMENPRELMSLQFRGLTSFGGLIFGFGAAMLWAKRKGIPVRNLLDATAPAFLVGHLIGRVGCLLNGCCFGGSCPVSVPWGIHVDSAPGLHHPAQIYDSLMNLAALGAVLAVERRGTLKPGQVTGLAIALHGLARFIYEFWRAGTEAQVKSGQASSTYWGSLPFTQAQAMAAVLILLGGAMFAFARHRSAVPAPTEDVSSPQPAV
jgi:phosphatidylglycerol:prolipoprotein diacylglycerol transferase